MRRRVLRAAVVLAASAEDRIRTAGSVPPPRDALIAALFPYARAAVRASRWLDTSRWLCQQAEDESAAAGGAALGAVRDLVAGWLADTPPAQRHLVDFDPAAFRVALEPVPLEDLAVRARESA